MTHKGPIPNIFKGLGGLFGDTKKPEPGRKPTKLPPSGSKGQDPTKNDGYRGTTKPGAAPKLPEKKEPANLEDIRKGAITILPDKRSEWSRPWIVENRYGGDEVQEMNQKVAAATLKAGNVVFGKGFSQIGGPKPGKWKEYYLDNPDTDDAKPRTTKGYSFMDMSYRIDVKRGNKTTTVYVHIDTYTAKKDLTRDKREQKQHERVEYNNRRKAFIVSIPKPGKGEEIDYGKWDTFIFDILVDIRNGIEAGEFEPSKRSHLVEVRFSKLLTRMQ